MPVRQQAQAATENSVSNSATNNSGNFSSQEANDNSRNAESIRQSEDTSATLSVTEERTVATEDQSLSGSPAQNDDNPRKSEPESKRSTGTGTDNSSLKSHQLSLRLNRPVLLAVAQTPAQILVVGMQTQALPRAITTVSKS